MFANKINRAYSCYVIGSLNLDCFVFADGSTVYQAGGMALNAFTALHSEKANVCLVASVGTDVQAKILQDKLKDLDEPSLEISINSTSQTGLAEYLVTDGSADLINLRLHAALGIIRLRRIISTRTPILAMGASIDDLKLLYFNKPFLWNPGLGILKTGRSEIWPKADVLFVNTEEWECYRDQHGPSPRMVVLTKHAAGAEIIVSNMVIAQAIPDKIIRGIDVGAGDHFAGIFASSYLKGASGQECLYNAVVKTEQFLADRPRIWE